MGTTVKVKSYSGRESNLDIQEFIAHSMEDDDYYSSGAVESAATIARNTAKGLGALCQLLHEKNVIDSGDLLDIAAYHGFTLVTFEEED